MKSKEKSYRSYAWERDAGMLVPKANNWPLVYGFQWDAVSGLLGR